MSRLRRKMCIECRTVTLISEHRNRCKPCYNEWFRLYRLEKKAQKSEGKA